MNTRRSALTVLASWFFKGSLSAQAPTPPRPRAKEVARHALTGAQAGMEAILVEVVSSPGVPSAAHRHPGFVMGYVLEGEMSFAINGNDEQVIKAGGSFFEPIGALHTKGASAKPDTPVRFLAFIVAPKGSPVTLPA